MHVEVTTPEQNVGDVVGDINGRRGRIEGMEPAMGGVTDRQLARAALRDVRIRHDAAVSHPGSSAAQRDAFALRGSPEQYRGGDYGEGPGRPVVPL